MSKHYYTVDVTLKGIDWERDAAIVKAAGRDTSASGYGGGGRDLSWEFVGPAAAYSFRDHLFEILSRTVTADQVIEPPSVTQHEE